jgi:hypothetical protein
VWEIPKDRDEGVITNSCGACHPKRCGYATAERSNMNECADLKKRNVEVKARIRLDQLNGCMTKEDKVEKVFNALYQCHKEIERCYDEISRWKEGGMMPSENFGELIREIAFEIMAHDIEEIGEHETLCKIIADVFDDYT